MLQELKVLVINLDRRPDRWASAQKTLRKAGFKNIIRVPAVDGKLIDTDQLKQLVDPSVCEKLGKIRKKHEDLGSLGAIGCYLSHYKCWMMIMEFNEPCIVVEDDLECHPKFNDFELVKNTYPLNQYDFMLLASHVREPKLLKKTIHKGISNYRGMFFGLHFYYLTPSGARFFAQDSLPIKYQVDSYMSFKLKETPEFRAGVHKPDLADQTDSVTDIQTLREGDIHYITYIVLKTIKTNPIKICIVCLFILMVIILIICLLKFIKKMHE